MNHSFKVCGRPRPQPRPRFSANGHAYNPPTANEWKKLIKAAAIKVLPKERLEGPIELRATFLFPRPKCHYLRGELRSDAPSRHVQVPDLDNLEKALMDALSDIGFWRDDCLVCSKLTDKWFSDPPHQPGVYVHVRSPSSDTFFACHL